MLAVVLPTILASTYYFGIAADEYVSEAKFVVRGGSSKSPGLLSGILQTAGVTRAADDTYAVEDYIISRDALAELIATQNLRDVYAPPDADPLSRFPTAFIGNSFEHFYKYYQRHVNVLVDSETGVATLTVRTFRPADSKRIAEALLDASERLVNRMNNRQRDNTMRDAQRELALSEQRVQSVAKQIADFRNREAMLDPTRQVTPVLQGIADLEKMRSRTDLALSQLKISAPHSPLIADYQRRLDALQAQIDKSQSEVTGSDASFVPKITTFDMLSLQREFADRQLISATTSLENARAQAERQLIYVDLIVQPNLADYALYPKRLASVAVVFATALSIYLMYIMLLTGARERQIS